LDPFAPWGGRGRAATTYFSSLSSIAALGAGLVVYTQHEHVDPIARHLEALGIPSRVIGRELEAVPRFAQIQEIRTPQGIHDQPYRDRCHALCHAKLSWLAEQVEANPFASERFYWIDAGISYSALFPPRYLPDDSGSACALFKPEVLEALATGQRLP